MKKECQREYKNLTIGSEKLIEMENIQYCEEITASYLTKYFPYQCGCCQRFTNTILIVKCSPIDMQACDTPICVDCSLEVFEGLKSEGQVV